MATSALLIAFRMTSGFDLDGFEATVEHGSGAEGEVIREAVVHFHVVDPDAVGPSESIVNDSLANCVDVDEAMKKIWWTQFTQKRSGK